MASMFSEKNILDLLDRKWVGSHNWSWEPFNGENFFEERFALFHL
jgi:hypothetical protein